MSNGLDEGDGKACGIAQGTERGGPAGDCIAAADPDVLEWNVVELDDCDTDMMTAVERSYRYLVGNGLAGNA